MRNPLRICTLLICLTVCGIVSRLGAAEPDWAALSRLMDESAIAVVRVDLTRAKMAPLGFFLPLAGDLQPGRLTDEEFQRGARRMQETMGSQAFLIISVPTSKDPPFVWAAPLDDPDHAHPPKQAQVVDNIAIFGPELMVGRALAARDAALAQKAPGTGRGNLAEAFAAAGDASLAIAFVPSADQRRVLAELTPNLPKEMGGSDLLRELLREIDWAAVGYEEGEVFRLVLSTPSEEAAVRSAHRLEELLEAFVAASGKAAPESAHDLLAAVKRLSEADKPKHRGRQVIYEVDGAALAAALEPAFVAASHSANRREAMNRLKVFGLALHNFRDAQEELEAEKRFPDAASLDADGKPLLSWRVHVLPYLDQKALYEEFHLDEPWDSEHNKKLIVRMPDVYRLPGSQAAQGKTNVVLPIGPETAFPHGRGLELRQFTDGTSNTILVVDADDEHAVTWTAPEDLAYDAKNPTGGLSRRYGDGVLALIADGSVHFLPSSIDPEQLRRRFTPAGGEVIER